MKTTKPLLVATLALGLAAPAFATTATVMDRGLTQAEVEAAQVAWGEALVAISTAHETEGPEAAKVLAEQVLDTAYGYGLGPVLFKPTLTEAPQTFRTTKEGALAYFVGQNPDFPDDTGFALKGWTDVQIENAAIFIDGNVAKTMGNVMITNKDGSVTTVDKTWGFVRDTEGALRIVLHHSSLPYTAN
ncbi:MAG: hypothetical protein C0426_03805 [Rhodobacter sp.]|nr:hypothetical protein [Rhodobacter sp.]